MGQSGTVAHVDGADTLACPAWSSGLGEDFSDDLCRYQAIADAQLVGTLRCILPDFFLPYPSKDDALVMLEGDRDRTAA
jgi:hypothetical protein